MIKLKKIILLALPVIIVGAVGIVYRSKGEFQTGFKNKATLVWSDEFKGENGAGIDATKWVQETGGEGWGNSEDEFYTSGTNNCYIDNNQLVIEAKKENKGNNKYTSARIKTQGKFEFKYGRVEMRAKIPYGQGIWPAFWMLGADIEEVNWPNCGEVDIMENIGKEPKIVHGTAHGPGYNGSMGIGAPFSLKEAFYKEYHIYSIEWSKDKIEWYVDGVKYHSLTPKNIFKNKWVFNKNFFLLINLAVGGSWPGYVDDTTIFPQKYYIDYVRVYN